MLHAGTAQEGEQFRAAGGRVLNIVGRGENLDQAREAAYATLAEISLPGGFYRSDIGASAATITLPS